MKQENIKNEASVIVVTYNSDARKTLCTLNSILMQTDVIFNIVIADDGSEENNFEAIKQFFASRNFDNYTLVANGKNQGTVKNLISAMPHVNAPYVKTISPADYLYEPQTLRKSLDFMHAHKKCDLMFGQTVYYSHEDFFVINENGRNPEQPEIYDPSKYIAKKAINHIIDGRDFILGAAMFYKTSTLDSCLNLLKDRIILCEDTSQQIIALQGGVINKIDDYVVWYEYGTGISTPNADPKENKLTADAITFYKMAMDLWPEHKQRFKRAMRIWDCITYSKRIPYIYNRLTSASHIKYLATYNIKRLQRNKSIKPKPNLDLYSAITQID